MTDKDPKDMTASELLRWAVNGDEYVNPINGESWETFTGKLKSFVEWESGDWPNEARLCDYLVGKIDAELAQARELSLRQGAELWAKANGWPDFREREDFGQWLDRCALPRPRFEDGEPVQYGDLPVGLDGVEKFIFTRSCGGSCQMQDADGNMLTVFPGGSAKRPAPEALGADGLPIREGETVWDVYGSGPAEVYRIGPADDEDGPVVWDIEGNYTMPYLLTHERPVLGADGLPLKVGECVYGVGSRFKKFPIVSVHRAGDTINGITADSDFVMYEEGYDWAEDLTHTPPETQERIDGDAAKDHVEYWRCSGFDCAECPSKIDGEKPWERYECSGACCDHAMTLDLLRRQRELDARKGGE